jgi:hypothetical protein
MNHESLRFPLIGTALVCLSILAYEILATRIVGVALDLHFVILPIALAMMGMGIATSFMSLGTWSEVSERRTATLSWLACGLGLSYVFSLAVLTLYGTWVNTGLDTAMDAGGLSALADTIRDNLLIRLIAAGAALISPFFIFGLFIAYLFRSLPGSDYHRFYAADLIGAAAGCILAIVSLNYLGYAGCLGLILISAFMGAIGLSGKAEKGATFANCALTIMALVLVANPAALSHLEPQPQINKLSRNYNKSSDVEERWHVWNALSRVAFLGMRNKESGKTWAVYAHEGGQGWASVPGANRYSLTPLATALQPNRVLVLFAGVGADMVEVDRQCGGTCEISGVEINRHMVEHARSEGFPGLNDLTGRPGIELHIAEAREYLERDDSEYDSILLSWWGAGVSHYVGTSGKLAQYLYTKEAFESLLDHLTPEGVIVMYNGSKAQALMIFRRIFEEKNLGGLRNRVIIARGKAEQAPEGLYDIVEDMRLIIKPSGFTSDDIDRIAAVADSLNLEIILSPNGINPDYAVYQDIASGADLERINESLLRDHGVELSIVSDDRPFFDELIPRSYYLDPTKWFESEPSSVLWKTTQKTIYYVIILCYVASVLIMGPLFIDTGPMRSRQNMTELFYFLALGAGFMLIEIGLIRKLGLILGHPVYSI